MAHAVRIHVNTSQTDRDKESSFHDKPIKTEYVDPVSNSRETCKSKRQPENGTIGTLPFPVKYHCGTCGASYTDLLDLKEHTKDHKPQEESTSKVIDLLTSQTLKESRSCDKPIKTECVEPSPDSSEIRPSKFQSDNTTDDQEDGTSSLPVKYFCACGVSNTDPMKLKEHMKVHMKHHKLPEVKSQILLNQQPVGRPVRRKKRKIAHEISDETRIAMRELLMSGASKLDISRVLNIPVTRVRKMKKNTWEVSEEIENYIAKCIHEDRFFRYTHLMQAVKQEYEVIQEAAIRHVLVKNGYAATGYQQRRQLTDDVVAQQFAWAKSHLEWTDEDWGRVLWTGEASFRTYAHPDPHTPCHKSMSRRLIWHLADEDPTGRAIRSSKTGKAGVRVWACMCLNGFGKFCRIEEPFDPVKYLKILQDYMLPSAWALIGSDFIFQHSSDHATDDISVQRWLKNPVPAEKIEVMALPVHSNNVFNPLENHFNNLCFSLDGFESDDPDEFWKKIEETLQSSPVSVCKRLMGTMRERCAAVLEAGGRYNKNCLWN